MPFPPTVPFCTRVSSKMKAPLGHDSSGLCARDDDETHPRRVRRSYSSLLGQLVKSGWHVLAADLLLWIGLSMQVWSSHVMSWAVVYRTPPPGLPCVDVPMRRVAWCDAVCVVSWRTVSWCDAVCAVSWYSARGVRCQHPAPPRRRAHHFLASPWRRHPAYLHAHAAFGTSPRHAPAALAPMHARRGSPAHCMFGVPPSHR